jgi:hypothetical protein
MVNLEEFGAIVLWLLLTYPATVAYYCWAEGSHISLH